MSVIAIVIFSIAIAGFQSTQIFDDASGFSVTPTKAAWAPSVVEQMNSPVWSDRDDGSYLVDVRDSISKDWCGLKISGADPIYRGWDGSGTCGYYYYAYMAITVAVTGLSFNNGESYVAVYGKIDGTRVDGTMGYDTGGNPIPNMYLDETGGHDYGYTPDYGWMVGYDATLGYTGTLTGYAVTIGGQPIMSYLNSHSSVSLGFDIQTAMCGAGSNYDRVYIRIVSIALGFYYAAYSGSAPAVSVVAPSSGTIFGPSLPATSSFKCSAVDYEGQGIAAIFARFNGPGITNWDVGCDTDSKEIIYPYDFWNNFVSGSYTVQYFARDGCTETWGSSPAASFIVDKTGPQFPADVGNLPTDSQWFGRNALSADEAPSFQIRITDTVGVDPGTVQCTVAGTPFSLTFSGGTYKDGTWILNKITSAMWESYWQGLPTGKYTAVFSAADTYGQAGTPRTVTFYKDLDSPIITPITPVDDDVFDESVPTFRATMEDIVPDKGPLGNIDISSATCTVSGELFTMEYVGGEFILTDSDWPAYYQTNLLPNTLYGATFEVEDTCGNDANVEVEFYKDTAFDDVTITLPDDSVTIPSYGLYDPLPEFLVWAYDDVNAVLGELCTVNIEINGWTYAMEHTSSYWYELAPGLGDWTIFEQLWHAIPRSNTEPHIATVHAYDKAGNEGTDTVSFFKTFDSPFITFLSPLNGYGYASSPDYELEVYAYEDLALLYYEVDGGIEHFLHNPGLGIYGGTPIPGKDYTRLFQGWIDTTDWQNAPATGPIELAFTVTDTQTPTPKTRTFTIEVYKDTIPPNIEITSPDDGTMLASTPPSVTVEVEEEYLYEISYSFDNLVWTSVDISSYQGQTNPTITFDVDNTLWNSQDDGDIDLIVRARDTADWQASDRVELWKDTTAPSMILQAPVGGTEFYETPPMYSAEIIDATDATLFVSSDGGASSIELAAYQGSLPYNFWSILPYTPDPFGTPITLTFIVADSLGNENSIAVDVWKYDSRPVVGILAPEIGQVYGKAPPSYELSIAYFGGVDLTSKIWYAIAGDTPGTVYTSGETGVIDYSAWINHTNGSIEVTFYVESVHGRVAATTISLERDISGPVMEILAPKTNEFYDYSAPAYSLVVKDARLKSLWVSLDNGTTKYPIALDQLTGTIDQSIWDLEENIRKNVTITFIADDEFGNTNQVTVLIHRTDAVEPGDIIERPTGTMDFTLFVGMSWPVWILGIAAAVGTMLGSAIYFRRKAR